MLSKSMGRSLVSGTVCELHRRVAVGVLVGAFVLAASGSVRAGGTCVTNADCNQSPNFCRPGVCDLFGQCQYQHDDGLCRVPPGDNLFCNGVNYCNETLNGGAGGCAINPVNCVPPTPYCNETIDACVECLSNSNCTTPPRLTCKASTGVCVECTADLNCNDGVFCNGQETCNQTTGLCQAGTPVSCSPGKFCSEIYLGVCVGCEFNDDCQDPLYCNGQETCSPTTHLCVAGTAPACKSCVGGTSAGTPCLVNGDCSGGGTCTGAATFCNEALNICVQCNTNSQCPKDLDYCTDAACIFNQCIQIANPVTKCGDGLWCNGAESCLSSQPGSACAQCLIENPNSESTCKTQKRCTGGLHPTCAADSQCIGAYVCSNAPEVACSNNLQCPAGGTCNVNSKCALACCGPGIPVDCDDSIACTMDKCDESNDVCTHAPATHTCNNATRTPCDTLADCPAGSTSCGGLPYCDDGKFCNGQETCGALGCENLTSRVCNIAPETVCTSDADCPSGGLCQIDCSYLNSGCSNGQCDETTDQCKFYAIHQGELCDDADPCTINTLCTGGLCLPSTTVNNAYRCVRLEWRNVTPQPVAIGDFITADLYAVADGCGSQYKGACQAGEMDIFAVNVLLDWNPVPIRLDPPGNPNPENPCSSPNTCYQCQTCSGGTNPGAQCIQRCVNGPRNWLTCLADTDCNHQCSGGTNNGAFCTVPADCPGGGSCISISATCSSAVMTCLGGSNNGGICTVAGDCPGGACSTQFSCTGGGVCGPRPTPNVYNWFSSSFLNDCAGDGVNGPCPYTGFPGNDGNAVYTSFDQLQCDASFGPAACVTPSGLFVTRFRFKAIRGGQNEIAIGLCTGDFTKSSVNSAVPPPSGLTSTDVLKTIGPAAQINVKCNTAADCDDLNVCTTDTCVNNNCVRTNNTLACDDGLYCTPNDVCSSGVCVGSGTRCVGSGTCVGGANSGASCTSAAGCPNGWCTAISVCDEANDRCVQCLTATTCHDNNLCTQDICNASGMCENPPNDCSDGLGCTADTCAVEPANPPQYPTPHAVCKHPANDAFCSTGLFCSAKVCDPNADAQQNPTGCVFAYPCGPGNGNPCTNPTTCNESTDTCGGCRPAAVVAKGSRYIGITPNISQGSTPVSIFVAGDCATPDVACLGKYVSPHCAGGANDGGLCLSDANCPKTCGGNISGTPCTSSATCTGGAVCLGSCDKGFLDSSPVYMTAAEWGSVNVHDAGIRPLTKYEVFIGCNLGGPPVLSAPSTVQAYRWGDTNGDGIVDFSDISGVVNAFKNVYSSTQTYQSTNVSCGDPQAGCIGQDCINFNDVSMTVDAFKGNSFPCQTTCP